LVYGNLGGGEFLGFFGHKTEPKVMLSYDVIMKCQCAMCPVQANSACAKPKIAAREEMLENMRSGNTEKLLGPGSLRHCPNI
jgi:hypothetical protein